MVTTPWNINFKCPGFYILTKYTPPFEQYKKIWNDKNESLKWITDRVSAIITEAS